MGFPSVIKEPLCGLKEPTESDAIAQGHVDWGQDFMVTPFELEKPSLPSPLFPQSKLTRSRTGREQWNTGEMPPVLVLYQTIVIQKVTAFRRGRPEAATVMQEYILKHNSQLLNLYVDQDTTSPNVLMQYWFKNKQKNTHFVGETHTTCIFQGIMHRKFIFQEKEPISGRELHTI